jgi:hypothetical protein
MNYSARNQSLSSSLDLPFAAINPFPPLPFLAPATKPCIYEYLDVSLLLPPENKGPTFPAPRFTIFPDPDMGSCFTSFQKGP